MDVERLEQLSRMSFGGPTTTQRVVKGLLLLKQKGCELFQCCLYLWQPYDKMEIGDLNRETELFEFRIIPCFSVLQKLVHDRGHQHWCNERRCTGAISPRSSMLKGWAATVNNSHRVGSTKHIHAKPNERVKTKNMHKWQFVDYTGYTSDFGWKTMQIWSCELMSWIMVI